MKNHFYLMAFLCLFLTNCKDKSYETPVEETPGLDSFVEAKAELPENLTPNGNTESYAELEENEFESPVKSPLSTFSIDVDNASYTNIRRFINNGQTVPKDAVRVEEMMNFF